MSIERIGGAKTGSGGQHLPFCQATVANGFVFVSGQVAMGDDGQPKHHEYDGGRTPHDGGQPWCIRQVRSPQPRHPGADQRGRSRAQVRMITRANRRP